MMGLFKGNFIGNTAGDGAGFWAGVFFIGLAIAMTLAAIDALFGTHIVPWINEVSRRLW